MTPTEQDNELRRNICGIATGVLWGKNFNELTLNERSRVNAMAKDLEAYITADRKRVALEEWEIANEAVLKNAKVINDEQERLEALALVDPKRHNDEIGSFMDRAFGFDLAFQPFAEARRKRIAELKAQQEEV